MVKRTVFTLLIVTVLTGISNAQSTGLGLGIILGEPTGISLKYWTERTTAFDAAVAWSVGKNGGMQFHGDYLWHNFTLFNVGKNQLPVYYGIGFKFGAGGEDPRVGIRGVAGLAYLMTSAPLDIFFELVPILEISPDVGFGFNGAIGFRYFF